MLGWVSQSQRAPAETCCTGRLLCGLVVVAKKCLFLRDCAENCKLAAFRVCFHEDLRCGTALQSVPYSPKSAVFVEQTLAVSQLHSIRRQLIYLVHKSYEARATGFARSLFIADMERLSALGQQIGSLQYLL